MGSRPKLKPPNSQSYSGLGQSRTDRQGKRGSSLGAVAQRLDSSLERVVGPNARRVLDRRPGQGLGGKTSQETASKLMQLQAMVGAGLAQMGRGAPRGPHEGFRGYSQWHILRPQQKSSMTPA